ncbi:MAG: zinc-binding protein [Candidatus Melainabacteria bacterium]|nr:MAG: zinc-binding protein [Candidatus Melainabacteria bacterium]
MVLEDKTITCRTCETPFVFSIGEQEFFALKGLKNMPVRCPNCRTSLKLFKKGKAADDCTDVPCHTCGEITRVPFKPTGLRPVFCHTCFHKQKIPQATAKQD